MKLTAAKAIVRGWLAAWYGARGTAMDVVQDYRAVLRDHPAFVADMARFCCAFDTTNVEGDPGAMPVNEGKRQWWLHFQAMAGVQFEDLPAIQRRTEIDE